MNKPSQAIQWISLLFLGMGALASCSAVDEPPFGALLEPPGKANASKPLNPSEPTVHPGPPYPTSEPGFHLPMPPSEALGIKLSPLETIIAETCRSQVWSQYVPNKDCTKDNECGDGFCDRGHCGAIVTCTWRMGQRCKANNQCPGLCIDGRCRSCVSNAECASKYGRAITECDPAPPGLTGMGRFCNSPMR
jgi:hypothetical protein